jgi:uncharacterized membrane protein YecN with MAPEG domain
VLLNVRVSLSRVATDTMIGTDVSKKSQADSKPQSPQAGDQGLSVNSRCHGNFVENVPFALLVASIAELNGANSQVMVASLATLLFLRIVHVEFGLRAERSMGWGRPVGYFGTLLWHLGMSGYAAWLATGFWSA